MTDSDAARAAAAAPGEGRPRRDIDFLVFSSHKTATQTVRRSLENAGRRVRHCHTLDHPDSPVAPGRLQEFAAASPASGRLQVISVFREPVGRLVSSMFQWHGAGVLRTGQAATREDTLVHRLSAEELRDYFVREYADGWGGAEAIPELAGEFGVGIGALRFDADRGIGSTSLDACDIHLMRFDQLVRNPAALLGTIVGAPIVVRAANLTDRAWYAATYRDFLERLVLPRALVERLYEERRELVDLFHPEGFDVVVHAAVARYCN
jgi:hypothetical protein